MLSTWPYNSAHVRERHKDTAILILITRYGSGSCVPFLAGPSSPRVLLSVHPPGIASHLVPQIHTPIMFLCLSIQGSNPELMHQHLKGKVYVLFQVQVRNITTTFLPRFSSPHSRNDDDFPFPGSSKVNSLISFEEKRVQRFE